MTDKINEIMNHLSDDERREALKILREIATDGKSDYLQALYDEDYEEIPVDIDTYIESDNYIGKFTNNGKAIYPYWREKLRELFRDPGQYQECALTGCLSGNTMIPLLNGTNISMRDLAEIGDLDEYVYSFDVETNKYVPGHLIKAFSTGVKSVYKISLDNGEYIIATSNHKFMTRDKHWKSIDTGLSAGDSMMPLYRGLTQCGRGMYETVKHPQKDGTFIEEPTHRMVMRNKIGLYKGVVHHKDFDRMNNDPRNLLKTDWMTHRMYHAKKGGLNFKEYNQKYRMGALDEDTLRKVRDGQRKGTKVRWSNPDEHIKMSQITRDRMVNGFSHYMSSIRWSDPDQRAKVSEQIAKSNRDPELNIKRQICKAVKICSLVLSEHSEITEELYEKTKKAHNMRSGYPCYRSVLKYITEPELYELALNYNHKIVSIEYIGEEEVFDLTVERYHNFATESGIVAHNSIGTGKSTIACVAMSYLLYQTMCLRDPQKYYRLAAGSTIVFAFFNNTLDLSSSVGYSTVQNIVQNSPWFLERGTVSGLKNLEYIPNKLIRFRVGSTAAHALGTNIISCLTGDTVIRTSHGDRKIEDLVNECVHVMSYGDNKLELSELAVVVHTRDVNELYEIELEDDTLIRCTPEHRFMTSTGKYTEARSLTSESNLLFITDNGTESIPVKHIQIRLTAHRVPVYDVINADPYNNFLISTSSGYIISHNCMIDEMNFKAGANVNMEQSKIMETYNGCFERMQSRFLVDGKIAGKMFLVSSKKSEYDFLESYIKKKKDKPNVLVCDAPLWEVKPSKTYSGKMFQVALGGATMPSKIIPEEEVEYTIQFSDGSSKKLHFNDRVRLRNGSYKLIQDVISGDDIVEIITQENI